MSKKKGAGIAAIIIIAAIGGLAGYSAMLKQQESGPAPVVTTINREDNKSDVGSTSIAENPQARQQDSGSPIANNTVFANNTIIINKPVYRNNTIIYQPVTINLENYRTTINQHVEQENKGKTGADKPVDKSHSITIFANRIKSDGWSAKFTDDKAGMFAAVYDIKGNLVKTGYADERGFTVKGLENKLYFVYPSDCNNCDKSKDDIMFKQWEDGSKDRPRLVPADSEVTASYTLVVPEKPKLVPLIPPGQTETAPKPEINLDAQDSTNVYGWVQMTAEVENKMQGYDQIVISVYAPNGTLHDSFSYSDQQGFFASREAGEGDYKIVATYKYNSGSAQAEIMHPFKFAKPAFANLSAREDNGTVTFGGTLTGGLPRENITIAVNNPENETIKKYSTSFATKPVFTLFISAEEAASIFNETGNYTFVVAHLQTGVQGKTMLVHNATGAAETSTAPLNVSNSTGKSQRPEIAVQGSNVYLVWQLEDEASGQHQIMFAKSNDSGATFSKPISLSEPQEAGFSLDPSIAVAGNNVYVVWANYNGQEQAAVAFRSSNDSGKTFGNTSILGNYTGENPRPHIALFKGDIYVSWITGANEEFTGNLIIAKSHEGTTFEAAIVSKDASNSSMASSDALYLAWRQYPSGDTTTDNSTNIFASSLDGTNFETSEELQGMTIFSVAASGNTSYVGGAGFKGEDVIVARSTDGSTFNTTSVANGSFPEVAAAQDNVYVIWTDDDNKVFFAASTDMGKTFGERQNLSNEGFEPAIVTGDGKVYTAWEEGSDIMFTIK